MRTFNSVINSVSSFAISESPVSLHGIRISSRGGSGAGGGVVVADVVVVGGAVVVTGGVVVVVGADGNPLESGVDISGVSVGIAGRLPSSPTSVSAAHETNNIIKTKTAIILSFIKSTITVDCHRFFAMFVGFADFEVFAGFRRFIFAFMFADYKSVPAHFRD